MKKNKLLFALAYSGMFMLGYIDGLRGPLIPGIRETFGINYTSVGTIFFSAGLGFLIATFFAGMFCDRLGPKKVLLFGYLIVISGIIGISLSPVFGALVFMMGFMNIGMGSVEIGVNTLVSGIEVKNQAVVMNLFYFFYGAGATIGPRYSGELLSFGFGWRKVYIYSLFVICSIFIYMICVKFPKRPVLGIAERLPLSEIVKNKRVLLFGSALGLYVACEIGISNWFVNYLTVVYKMDEIKSSTYLSIFFIMFTAGRLLGGFIVERMGYFNSIIVFMILSLIFFSTGTLLGEKYVIFISFCGMTYSIVYPTIVSSIIKEFRRSTGAVLGFAITMSSGISMIFNWFIGKLNDLISVRLGFMIIIPYIICEIILVAVLKSGYEKRIESMV